MSKIDKCVDEVLPINSPYNPWINKVKDLKKKLKELIEKEIDEIQYDSMSPSTPYAEAKRSVKREIKERLLGDK